MPLSDAANTAVIELTGVLVAVTEEEPRILVIEDGKALPSGPLVRTIRRSIPACVRGSSARPITRSVISNSSTPSPIATAPTAAKSFGLLSRPDPPDAPPGRRVAGASWYDYFPWEDRRAGPAPAASRIVAGLRIGRGGARSYACSASGQRIGIASATAPRPGTRNWCCNVTNCCSRPGWCRRRRDAPDGAAADRRAGDDARPPPHPGHRHRPAAREDQIPPGRLRADAPQLYPAPVATQVEAVAGRPCTSRISAG